MNTLTEDLLELLENNCGLPRKATTKERILALDNEFQFSEDQSITLLRLLTEDYNTAVVTGRAGSGKSYLLRALKEYLYCFDVAFVVAAPTGIAAQNVGGGTINSTFKLGLMDQFPMEAGTAAGQRSISRWGTLPAVFSKHKLCFVIIDEAFASSSQALILVSQFLERSEITCRFVLIGDPLQLPPVSSDEKPTNFVWEDAVWKVPGLQKEVVVPSLINDSTLVMGLTHNHRQESSSEGGFVNDLNHARLGLSLGQWLRKCRVSRVRPIPSLATHIYSTNKEVKRKNAEALAEAERQGKETRTFRARVTLNHSGRSGVIHSIDRDGVLVWDEGEGVGLRSDFKERQLGIEPIELVQKLAVGLPFMIRQNIANQNLFNGTVGIIHAFTRDGFLLKLKSGQFQEIKPIEIIGVASNRNGDPVATVMAIPGHLCVAMTGHKVQGLTFDTPVVIHADQWSCKNSLPKWPGWVYVVLSRVTESSLLYIDADMQALSKGCVASKAALEFADKAAKVTAELIGKVEDNFSMINSEENQDEVTFEISKDGFATEKVFYIKDTDTMYLDDQAIKPDHPYAIKAYASMGIESRRTQQQEEDMFTNKKQMAGLMQVPELQIAAVQYTVDSFKGSITTPIFKGVGRTGNAIISNLTPEQLSEALADEQLVSEEQYNAFIGALKECAVYYVTKQTQQEKPMPKTQSNKSSNKLTNVSKFENLIQAESDLNFGDKVIPRFCAASFSGKSRAVAGNIVETPDNLVVVNDTLENFVNWLNECSDADYDRVEAALLKVSKVVFIIKAEVVEAEEIEPLQVTVEQFIQEFNEGDDSIKIQLTEAVFSGVVSLTGGYLKLGIQDGKAIIMEYETEEAQTELPTEIVEQPVVEAALALAPVEQPVAETASVEEEGEVDILALRSAHIKKVAEERAERQKYSTKKTDAIRKEFNETFGINEVVTEQPVVADEPTPTVEAEPTPALNKLEEISNAMLTNPEFLNTLQSIEAKAVEAEAILAAEEVSEVEEAESQSLIKTEEVQPHLKLKVGDLNTDAHDLRLVLALPPSEIEWDAEWSKYAIYIGIFDSDSQSYICDPDKIEDLGLELSWDSVKEYDTHKIYVNERDSNYLYIIKNRRTFCEMLSKDTEKLNKIITLAKEGKTHFLFDDLIHGNVFSNSESLIKSLQWTDKEAMQYALYCAKEYCDSEVLPYNTSLPAASFGKELVHVIAHLEQILFIQAPKGLPGTQSFIDSFKTSGKTMNECFIAFIHSIYQASEVEKEDVKAQTISELSILETLPEEEEEVEEPKHEAVLASIAVQPATPSIDPKLLDLAKRVQEAATAAQLAAAKAAKLVAAAQQASADATEAAQTAADLSAQLTQLLQGTEPELPYADICCEIDACGEEAVRVQTTMIDVKAVGLNNPFEVERPWEKQDGSRATVEEELHERSEAVEQYADWLDTSSSPEAESQRQKIKSIKRAVRGTTFPDGNTDIGRNHWLKCSCRSKANVKRLGVKHYTQVPCHCDVIVGKVNDLSNWRYEN